ncbi:hypothetical protein [Nesterenkonia flava]|uniref:Uncharacterized protein n=1 Tax=Nesterenkonia flava TaxID=469799 RepID=A0ABU1FRU4_9MICC|nr:hypothetical protein [Nesterenkonia flava]MDR5711387.1 hypothetical protein [Nesterenkonia flava]
MSPHRRIPRWFWSRVATPKWLTILSTIGYLVAFAAGGYAIINQPSSLEGAVGGVSMYSLSALLVIGGLIGAPTALFGEWKLERWAALLAGIGTLIYVLVIIALHFEGSGNRLLQAGEVTIGLLGIIARAVYVWQRPIAPARETVLGQGRL